MDIATDTVVRLGFQQGFRLFLHMSAIHPGQRGHVELEKDVFFLQGLVVLLLHVSGTLKGRAAGVLVPPIFSEKGTLITTNRSMGLSGSCPFYILCFNGVHGILHLQSGQNHCTLSVC